MLRILRENFVLKVISLMASIVLWLYVTAERHPVQITTRTVTADVVPVGSAPRDLIAEIDSDPIPVELRGPRSEIEAIGAHQVKAEVDLSSLREGSKRARVVRYRLPSGARTTEVRGRSFVNAIVDRRVRKSLRIQPQFAQTAVTGRRYGTPRLSPEWATVMGSAEEIRRVDRLVANIETNGLGVNADVPIKAVDKDGVDVTGVEIVPDTTHVELSLPEPPATRSLVVSVPHQISVAQDAVLSDVIVEPAQVTVKGPPDQLVQMTNVTTEQVTATDVDADLTREVRLQLPPGVTTVNGRRTVRVTFKVRELPKPPASAPRNPGEP